MLKFLLVMGILLLCMVGIAVRVLLVKGGTMRGTCASQTPLLNKEGVACGLCGRMPGEPCGDESKS
ncbi:MAG TPA: membrane or secreted protein [Bacteroidia bacterium]